MSRLATILTTAAIGVAATDGQAQTYGKYQSPPYAVVERQMTLTFASQIDPIA